MSVWNEPNHTRWGWGIRLTPRQRRRLRRRWARAERPGPRPWKQNARRFIMLAVLAALLAPSAAGAAEPTAAVTPGSGLADRQHVIVSWRGIAKGTTIDECSDPVEAGFPISSLPVTCSQLAEVRAGHGRARVRVRSGAVGIEGRTCEQGCVIAVFSRSASKPREVAIVVNVPIEFAGERSHLTGAL